MYMERWTRHVATIGESISVFTIVTGSTGKRPLRCHGRRWKNYIRIDLKERDVSMRNWINSDEDKYYRLDTELKLYKVMAVPIVIYGIKSWVLTQKNS